MFSAPFTRARATSGMQTRASGSSAGVPGTVLRRGSVCAASVWTGCRFREGDSEGGQLRAGDLAVELFRERLHAGRQLGGGEEMRRERLNREGEVHDLDRVAVAARDVHEPALYEQVDVPAAAQLVPRHPRPHLLARPERRDVDLP